MSGKNTPNPVWFNDGAGQFSDSLQRLGEADSQAAAAGDLNGDGFPDIVVGNRGPDEVWLNDGTGLLTDSGQRLGSSLTRYIFLVDLNDSGYLDIFASGQSEATIWFKGGRGCVGHSGRSGIRVSMTGGANSRMINHLSFKKSLFHPPLA